jgi:monofunctional biosynthetic peptidoglycan transglycosylase
MKKLGSLLLSVLRNMLVLAGGFLALYFGSVLVVTVLLLWMDPPVTGLMILRSWEGVKVQPSIPLPYGRIPSFARRGIVYLEDHEFWTHYGIVWGAVREAWEANERAGRVERGGSTITQQLARNLFLFPDRMYLRKGLEAGTALILETVLPKQRILELYLNHIEWGPGVFGIEAGARYQFGTGVHNLDLDQISRLEAIITNPVAYSVRTLSRNRGMEARYEDLSAWGQPPPSPSPAPDQNAEPSPSPAP